MLPTLHNGLTGVGIRMGDVQLLVPKVFSSTTLGF